MPRRPQFARAALESIPHQVADVVEAMARSGSRAEALHADGGPTQNDTLMQLQADLAGRLVLRSHTAELSALGAAHLAGHAAGLWSWTDLEGMARSSDSFEPAMPSERRDAERTRWRKAVARSRGN